MSALPLRRDSRRTQSHWRHHWPSQLHLCWVVKAARTRQDRCRLPRPLCALLWWSPLPQSTSPMPLPDRRCQGPQTGTARQRRSENRRRSHDETTSTSSSSTAVGRSSGGCWRCFGHRASWRPACTLSARYYPSKALRAGEHALVGLLSLRAIFGPVCVCRRGTRCLLHP